MTKWDPDQYAHYKGYRARPALDLMAQIPPDLDPHQVWDLGCGPGEQAAMLAARYPGAQVHGFDASDEMLARARARPSRVTWVQGDIAAFAPQTPPDLIFTNAALQWLPDHATLFPQLVGALAPGGVFACQVPMTHHEPWHVALRRVAESGPWAERMTGVRDVQPVAGAADYHAWLSPLAQVDIWSTRYLHVLEGEDPVVDWMLGTGLRPYLPRLKDEAERATFLAAYGETVARDFPRGADGTTLFPFPRLFIVARRRR